jgi:putative hydrolase of the HAD superfamily
MDIKAVCFDVDGTLYPKKYTNLKLIGSIFPSLFLALRYQRFRKKVRKEVDMETVPSTREGFRKRQAISILQDMHTAISPSMIHKMEARIEKQFYSYYRKSFSKIRPYEGMRETMIELKSRGCRIGILSDFPVEHKLEALKVADLVDFFCCSEDSGYLKPHPAPFHYLAERMNTEIRAILYVGDSYSKDIIGAEAVGMRTCMILPKAKFERNREKLKHQYPCAHMICSGYEDFFKRFGEMIDGGL